MVRARSRRVRVRLGPSTRVFAADARRAVVASRRDFQVRPRSLEGEPSRGHVPRRGQRQDPGRTRALATRTARSRLGEDPRERWFDGWMAAHAVVAQYLAGDRQRPPGRRRVKYLGVYRIATYLLVLVCAGHTAGGMLAQNSLGPESDAVFSSMKAVHFNFNGGDCTWYGFWFAFGLTTSAFLLFSAVVAWTLADRDPGHWSMVS